MDRYPTPEPFGKVEDEEQDGEDSQTVRNTRYRNEVLSASIILLTWIVTSRVPVKEYIYIERDEELFHCFYRPYIKV